MSWHTYLPRTNHLENLEQLFRSRCRSIHNRCPYPLIVTHIKCMNLDFFFVSMELMLRSLPSFCLRKHTKRKQNQVSFEYGIFWASFFSCRLHMASILHALTCRALSFPICCCYSKHGNGRHHRHCLCVRSQSVYRIKFQLISIEMLGILSITNLFRHIKTPLNRP